MLIARDSRGNIIADRMVPLGGDIAAERMLLWTFLNWRDPITDDRSGSFRV